MTTPDPKHISTSYVERQNRTMRMRRFTRLTNGFSKKLENHIAAVSLRVMYYNFVKTHGTVRVTPAMAAGVTSKLCEMSDAVELVESTARTGRRKAVRQRVRLLNAPTTKVQRCGSNADL